MTTTDVSHRKDGPKIAAKGAVGSVYLLNHTVPTRITHVYSLSTLPTYKDVQSIELILQTGSREPLFTAQNASISALGRKMRFFPVILSDIQS